MSLDSSSHAIELIPEHCKGEKGTPAETAIINYRQHMEVFYELVERGRT